MKLLVVAILAMSSSVFASTNAYELKMDLSLDGKHVSSPRVVVKEGELATVSQENGSKKQFIEVIATESSIQSHEGILMKFTVGDVGPKNWST